MKARYQGRRSMQKFFGAAVELIGLLSLWAVLLIWTAIGQGVLG